MTTTGDKRCSEQLIHTDDRKVVFKAEKQYLDDRRRKNDLPTLEEDPDLWGLAFSGGGVRSATFCLGVMQALTSDVKRLMKRFDYLSTVSGGGYIGSCLSSLLSGNPKTGLDCGNSPFTGLRDNDEYTEAPEAQLSVRHQIHHLRTHGEYLIPRSRLLSRDMQRALGSVFPGIFHTVTLFLLVFVALVAVTHLVLGGMDPGFETLAPNVTVEAGDAELNGGDAKVRACHAEAKEGDAKKLGAIDVVKTVPREWWKQRVAPPLVKLRDDALHWGWPAVLALAVLAAVWNLAAVRNATRLAHKFKATEYAKQHPIRSGWSAEDERESRFVGRFNWWSLWLTVGLMLGLVIAGHAFGQSAHLLAIMLVPLTLAAVGFFFSHVSTYVWESKFARDSWRPCGKDEVEENAKSTDVQSGGPARGESRFRRSLYASIRGACLLGLALSAATPIVLIVLFSLAALPLKLFWSLAWLAIAYLASRRSGGPAVMQLGGWLKRPLANAGVLLFLAFGFAEISALLLDFYRDYGFNIIVMSMLLAADSIALFVVFSKVIDANRISPHYFYRDRLTEAYLKTDARVLRDKDDPGQGMPLKVLRDSENLRLCDLGIDNGRGPYHLIVAALNLSGSKELNRKSFLSEHFIFSRDFVGSRVTGWVPTSIYRGGSTRLARAMTIAAAAVGSAMGPNTFAAQAFVMTLFNVRLGFWVDNPWIYKGGVPTKPRWKLVFWPRYLACEAFGRPTARMPRVNVSDGGHTGDNIALLPLLARRCKVIVVCDAEEDGDYTFDSFNNAVRMAQTEENISIDIDLTQIMNRRKTVGGYKASKASVAVGKVEYPRISSKDPAFTGRLVYIKASVNRIDVPVHVANYAKGHSNFPHETTADQFFDDAQFEAYRALGECLGKQAAGRL